MIRKLFLIGRPGSGKSTAARYMAMRARDKGKAVMHINDYEILRNMFLSDTEHKLFRPTKYGGFDALTTSVLDYALTIVEAHTQTLLSERHIERITIEFARDDYYEAFKQFSSAFLQDAYILYIDVDLETCLKRVHSRVLHSSSNDDHPSFSDHIFRKHYMKENKEYIACQLHHDYPMIHKPVVIDNNGLLQSFLANLAHITRSLFE